MPGILPMKVIKIGTSAQSRIAQACDRCRSKKIRCDGITPCCSQCTNVGFDCKTSDKLSRRAFPRGYTESLEERVRSLETELRELMNLLDEKDEKIDILSRIHSNSSALRRPSSVFSSLPEESAATRIAKTEDLDSDKFQVQQPRNSCDGARPEYDFRGPSSGMTFVDAFKEKLQASDKSCSDFKAETFFIAKDREVTPESAKESATSTAMAPPRIISDQMINIFFQEWAPLFPILHRPTILKVYLDYITNPKRVLDHHSIAQLNLLFGIASLSTEWKTQTTEGFEHQWQSALNCVVQDNSLPTLQCLVLAQMYYIAKGHYDNLMHYKGLAISISHRLGLHQDQSRFSFGTLTDEMRKRTFWTLYTLDCFSAAALGLPKMLPRDCDIQTEFPADVDDENVSEQGFQPTLPGESTRLSSALALFRGAQILSKVLDEVYPTASTYELSLHKICALSDELDTWHGTLQPHLRLQFVHEKPSTDVTGSRSPLLSFAYHYIRTLIHRPVVGSCHGVNASFAIVALAQSSKHIIQISQLLEDRQMSFSFCLNKHEILLLAGFGLLFQTFNLDCKGHLIRDSQRLLCSIISVLELSAAPGARDFKKIACAMISVDRFAKSPRAPNDEKSRQKSDGSISVSTGNSKSAHRAQSMIVRLPASKDLPLKQEAGIDRRFTAPDLSTGHNDHRYNFASTESDAAHSSQRSQTSKTFFPKSTTAMPNLDFLDFSHEAKPAALHESNKSANGGPNMELSRGVDHENVQVVQTPLDSLFPAQDPFSYISSSASNNALDWCGGDSWAELTQPTQSVLSEEELTSGEELSSCDMEGQVNNVLSSYQEHNKQELGDMDGGFGLYEEDGDLNFGQKSETD